MYNSSDATIEAWKESTRQLIYDREVPVATLINDMWRPFNLERDMLHDLYVPSETLIRLIQEYEDWCRECAHLDASVRNSRGCKAAGQVMEEIAFAAFACLKAVNIAHSGNFRGPDAQHDLLIRGIGRPWEILSYYLNLQTNSTTILLEAKNERSKVDVNQFSRLAFIMQQNFLNDCGLGVFFTREGATGMPASNVEGRRILAVKDTWLIQLIFHARTNKYLVVFDDNDIRSLIHRGALVDLLYSKIREVEERTGYSYEIRDGELENLPLPPFLEVLRQEILKQSN